MTLGTMPQYQVRRVGRTDESVEATSSIEVCDVRGEPLLSMAPGEMLGLIARLIEIAMELASEQVTVEGMMSVPAVTAVDLAAAFEMGRQAGVRIVGPELGHGGRR